MLPGQGLPGLLIDPERALGHMVAGHGGDRRVIGCRAIGCRAIGRRRIGPLAWRWPVPMTGYQGALTAAGERRVLGDQGGGLVDF